MFQIFKRGVHRGIVLWLSLLLLLCACHKTDSDSSILSSDLSSAESTASITAESSVSSADDNTSGTIGNQSKEESKTTDSIESAASQGPDISNAVDPKCTGYDYTQDSFYSSHSRIYASWVNIWYGSSESWYSAQTATGYTPKILVNGEYVNPDNNKQSHRQVIFDEAENAGINTLVMDLTNGYGSWLSSSKSYEKMCYDNGMKFAVAAHPKGASDVEDVCKFIWESYAEPGVATFSSSYFYKNGKPLMVLYCTMNEYNSSYNTSGEYRSKFEFVWASGEDSKADKWGWQLEAQDGPIASSDSMFITPSISWNSPQSGADAWRSSLAMLDFCFLAANESQPRYTIVGMIDDFTERNAWMKADTTNMVYKVPAIGDTAIPETALAKQMRDIYGNISTDTYYNRVCDWINGTAAAYNPGGIIADGAYTLTNIGNNASFGVCRPQAVVTPATDIGAAFQRGKYLTTPMETYYWFYHLGNNEYRIIKLTSGLSLQPDGSGILVQQWSNAVDEQRWIVTQLGNGNYQIINKSTGMAVTDTNTSDTSIRTAGLNSGDSAQQWAIVPVANRTIS